MGRSNGGTIVTDGIQPTDVIASAKNAPTRVAAAGVWISPLATSAHGRARLEPPS
jgi:hypothetical protein